MPIYIGLQVKQNLLIFQKKMFFLIVKKSKFLFKKYLFYCFS